MKLHVVVKLIMLKALHDGEAMVTRSEQHVNYEFGFTLEPIMFHKRDFN